MLVTFTFSDTDNLYCGWLDDLSFKLNNKTNKLEVYKEDKFLGNYQSIVGISEEDFIKFVQDYFVKHNLEIEL